jgi:hypothetical protein
MIRDARCGVLSLLDNGPLGNLQRPTHHDGATNEFRESLTAQLTFLDYALMRRNVSDKL